LDESEDIRLIKQRDWHGLEALIERYQLRAVRAAYLVIGDRAEAEDVVAEAFYRVWRQIDQFDTTRPFAPWFFTLVLNAARRVVSRSARFIDMPEEDPEEITFSDQTISSPEDEIIQAESEEAVRQTLTRLSLDQRVVIIQQYYLGWTVEQMAVQGNHPPGTIKWRLYRARNRLRGWLGQVDGRPDTFKSK
jgi:RNA polymerase sigma-70 factor (ECF subfamily)